MSFCVRCNLPLYEADQNARELILCCHLGERICPSCLADFMGQNDPQIVSNCHRCGRKIKLADLHRKYNLYTNNLDRMMVSSRVSVNDFESPTIQNNKRSTFNGNSSQGFGMQNYSNGFQNQSFGNCQQFMENKPFNEQQNRSKSSFNIDRFSNQGLSNVQKAQLVNVRPDELGFLGMIYYNEGRIKPIGMQMNSLSLGSDNNYCNEMSIQQRQPRFQPQSFKKIGHYHKNSEIYSKNYHQPTFGQNTFFSNEANNRKSELQTHQRSLSANNRILSQSTQQRPVSSNSRISKIQERNNKSPPSFGQSGL